MHPDAMLKPYCIGVKLHLTDISLIFCYAPLNSAPLLANESRSSCGEHYLSGFVSEKHFLRAVVQSDYL